MQDKDSKDVDDAEEALTTVKLETDSKPTTPDAKSPAKDGKFAFRRMKQPKKDKSSPSRFQGEGVVFKAKLIGVDSVPDARGDKMCQDAMHKLKQNVRNSGPHKRKINVCVSLQGIKIKDEKNTSVIHHHPVGLISFISQDITDARAFGYVVGSTDDPHQFIAIKTEKPAFHVVLAIRDLFQTVLNHKKEVIHTAQEKESNTDNQKIEEAEHRMKKMAEISSKPFEEQKAKEENIYFEVLLAEPLKMKDEEEEEEKAAEIEPVKTVDDLLGLQNELNKLQEGIDQMDTSIAAVAAFSSEVTPPENDPFDTSFVLGPKRDSIPFPMPTPVPVTSTVSSNETVQHVSSPSGNSEDKYAVFSAMDSGPSIFEAVPPESDGSELTEPEEIPKTAPPAKPPRSSKTNSPDLSVFADLDPLGKDRPYKDKTEFFQDVKNPPKKVLNDLVYPNKEAQRAFGLLHPSVPPFPVEFESNPNPTFPNPAASSSLPNSFHGYPKLSVPPLQNGSGDAPKQESTTPTKVLTSRASEPSFNGCHSENGHMNTTYLGRSPPSSTILGPTQQLTVSGIHSQTISSSPIPIPPRQTPFSKDRSFSSGSAGSPYSKSPTSYNPDSPNPSEYYLQNQSDYYSPNNGLNIKSATNGDYLPTISPPTMNMNRNTSHLIVNSQNGVSRPRPRPSLSKGSSSGHSNSSHSLSSDSSSDYEAISRESMQCITNVLLTNSHRLRAQSLCLDTNNHFSIGGDKNIFTKKNDPFADDFFFALPKKAIDTEIPEYM